MFYKHKRALLKVTVFTGSVLLVSLYLTFYDNGPTCKHCLSPPTVIPTRHILKAPIKAPVTPSDVLLLGYMRGGSTFLGEILGIRKNQFYVYEPLHRMAKYEYFKPGFVCSIMDTNCSKSNENDTVAIDVLRALYNCDYDTFQKVMLPWQLMKVNSSVLPKCEYTEPLCWHQILKSCSTSSSRVSKVLRVTVGLASRLLDMLPKLHIIHLLRDPRAIIDSRLRGSGNTTRVEIKSLCQKIKQDCNDSKEIQRTHPGRIHTIFYEDIASNPIESSKLYDLVGLSFETADYVHLRSMTKSAKNESVYNTARSNSKQTARKWRTNIPWKVVTWVNSECADIYEMLGYPQLQRQEDLFNDKIPLRTFTKSVD